MQNVIRIFLFSLGFFTAASAQLPPEVIADKYLVQAEQLFEKKDYVAALNMMDKISRCRKNTISRCWMSSTSNMHRLPFQ